MGSEPLQAFAILHTGRRATYALASERYTPRLVDRTHAVAVFAICLMLNRDTYRHRDTVPFTQIGVAGALVEGQYAVRQHNATDLTSNTLLS